MFLSFQIPYASTATNAVDLNNNLDSFNTENKERVCGRITGSATDATTLTSQATVCSKYRVRRAIQGQS